MNERIKNIRKNLKLSQTEFGARIGVKQTTVASWELGNRDPQDVVIKAICDTYNVSENWLRTGEGDMFVQISHKEKTVRFMADVAKVNGLDPEEGLVARIIDFLSDMSVEEWKTIANLAERWYQIEKAARDPEAAEDEIGRD